MLWCGGGGSGGEDVEKELHRRTIRKILLLFFLLRKVPVTTALSPMRQRREVNRTINLNQDI